MTRIRKTKRWGNSDIILLNPTDKKDLGLEIGSDSVDIEDLVIIKNHTADKTLGREDNNAFVGTTETNSNMSEVKALRNGVSSELTTGSKAPFSTPKLKKEEKDEK